MVGCGNDSEIIYGFIPVDQKANYLWHQNQNLKYVIDPRIMVVVKSDTIWTSFNREGFFSGSLCVLYKDTYPPAKGRIVFVRMLRLDNDVYYIQEASLDPFKID